MMRFVRIVLLFGIGLSVIPGAWVSYAQAQEEHPTPGGGPGNRPRPRTSLTVSSGFVGRVPPQLQPRPTRKFLCVWSAPPGGRFGATGGTCTLEGSNFRYGQPCVCRGHLGTVR